MPVSRSSSKRTPDSGQRREQELRVRVPGALDDRVRRRLLDELAGVHHEDRVGHLVEDREVVRDHDRALHEAAVTELDEQLGDRLLRRDVERGGQLVGDQERRVEERREHHHDPLLHAAGELDRVALEHVLGEPHDREPAHELGPHRLEARTARLEEVGDQPSDAPRRAEGAHRVLRHDRDLPEPVLGHCPVVLDGQRLSLERDRAAHVLHAALEPDEALPERGLPASRLAREPHDLPVGDREADAVERLHVAAQGAVVDTQVVDDQAHVRLSFGLKTSSSPTFIT